MSGRGGFQPRGLKRPDPESAGPRERPWVELMRRVYDELYAQGDPAQRLTVTALGKKAHMSTQSVSMYFSGQRHERKTFLSLVHALRGEPDDWKPRWHAADALARAAGESHDLPQL